jgi:hypothetical protein
MNTSYFKFILVVLFLTLSACTSTPKKETVFMEVEQSEPTEVRITTYECFADPNLHEEKTLKEAMQSGHDLSGTVLNCSGTTVIVDTVLDYGPSEVNILDTSTGKWQTYNTKDCTVINHQ